MGELDLKKRELYGYAFKRSIPILCGYLFLGAAFGIVMNEAGYGWYHSALASVLVYAGSGQFAMASLLSSGAALTELILTALLINSRQVFYALTFVDDFEHMGRLKPYMIHTVTDESYAVNTSLDIKGSDRYTVIALVSLFCHIYWICGTLLGAGIGSLIPFDMNGIDYCMTALFITIFLDQWRKTRAHAPALIGAAVSLACLMIFGESRFMLPALVTVSALLVMLAGRKDGDGA